MAGEELPRLAGLEGFEVWDKTVRAPEHREVKVAFVSVRVGGSIGMNKACYKMWGAPAHRAAARKPRRSEQLRALRLQRCLGPLQESL